MDLVDSCDSSAATFTASVCWSVCSQSSKVRRAAGFLWRCKRTALMVDRLVHVCTQQGGTTWSNYCFLLQVVPQDARANSAGGGSKRISWDSEWPQGTMVLLHDLECTFYMQSNPIRSHIEKFVTWLHRFFYKKKTKPTDPEFCPHSEVM